MQFLKLASLLAAAAATAVAQNTVTFQSLDSTDRTIYFTPNPTSETVDSVAVPGGQSVTVNIPYQWQGNWFSVSAGAEYKPGMLGEVAFQSWSGITFYDVSAIVDPTDTDGVKEIFPADKQSPPAGCKLFPCNEAYYQPDDVATKSTDETALVCTLGNAPAGARAVAVEAVDSPVFSRDWVLGKWTPKARAA